MDKQIVGCPCNGHVTFNSLGVRSMKGIFIPYTELLEESCGTWLTNIGFIFGFVAAQMREKSKQTNKKQVGKNKDTNQRAFGCQLRNLLKFLPPGTELQCLQSATSKTESRNKTLLAKTKTRQPGGLVLEP